MKSQRRTPWMAFRYVLDHRKRTFSNIPLAVGQTECRFAVTIPNLILYNADRSGGQADFVFLSYLRALLLRTASRPEQRDVMNNMLRSQVEEVVCLEDPSLGVPIVFERTHEMPQ